MERTVQTFSDLHSGQYAVAIGLVRGCGTWATPDGIEASSDFDPFSGVVLEAEEGRKIAEAAGTPKPIPHDVAKLIASQVGSHKGGYFSFQPLWDWITEAEPDLFN